MTQSTSRKKLFFAAPVFAAAVGLSLSHGQVARADGDPVEIRERCVNRVAISFLGKTDAASLAKVSVTDPQSSVDTLLTDPDFQERFSRFINARFNTTVGANSAEDASYHMMKYILQNNRPWKDMFVGQFGVAQVNQGGQNVVQVQADPNGLGYFRSKAWLDRYAGNELTGMKLSTAYRMEHNVLGLRLIASTNAVGADLSATGRQAAACKQCHFDGWYALDKVADVLTRVRRQGNNVTYDASAVKPGQLFGAAISDDKTLVEAMVNTEMFNFNVCRVAFNFLYGRDENRCEGPLFDQCVDAFKTAGTIQSAVSVVAKHNSFCQ
ncbi:MAG: hypothetical protein KBF88_01895 [Polyangiaceae bacterium]|nr:hypothetical protein [Polyangiaceae bacterium]